MKKEELCLFRGNYEELKEKFPEAAERVWQEDLGFSCDEDVEYFIYRSRADFARDEIVNGTEYQDLMRGIRLDLPQLVDCINYDALANTVFGEYIDECSVTAEGYLILCSR